MPSPTAATTAEDSWPSTTGVGIGNSPSIKCRSLWHSPAKAVRSSTSRGPGLVSATSSIVKGWFAACRTAAFIRSSLLEIEAQAGLGPIHRGELAAGGKCDVSGLHVRAAKADVGRIDIRHLDLPHDPSVGRDDGDIAGDQGRHRDIARSLDGEAVKALKAGQTAHQPAGIWCGERLLTQHAGRDDVKGEEPRALHIGDVDGLFIGRQADAVRAQHRVYQLDDLRAVGQGVIEPAMVAVAPPPFAEIGKVKPALAVENDV